MKKVALKKDPFSGKVHKIVPKTYNYPLTSAHHEDEKQALIITGIALILACFYCFK